MFLFFSVFSSLLFVCLFVFCLVVFGVSSNINISSQNSAGKVFFFGGSMEPPPPPWATTGGKYLGHFILRGTLGRVTHFLNYLFNISRKN